MWIFLALLSALFLGVYDVLRKAALRDNAVLPVLCLSTLTSSLLLLPLWVLSRYGALEQGQLAYVPVISAGQHELLLLKAAIVLSSWGCVYYGLRRLPLSIVAPIRATAPLWTLLGALLLFAEMPNATQWLGLVVTFAAFYLFAVAGSKEGIRFVHDRGVWCVVAGTLIGAASALFDKYIIQQAAIDRMAVLFYYSVYQFALTLPLLYIIWYRSAGRTTFHWHWCIPAIGAVIILADFLYYGSLGCPGAMISLISPFRRTNVVVSFTLAWLLFHEGNMRAKAAALAAILLGVGIIVYGSANP